MNRGDKVLVSCSIESGAFSGERVFRIKVVGCDSEYSGVAPVRYCFGPNQRALGPNDPAEGVTLQGYVEAFLISNGGDQANVELPDGESARVEISQVPFRQGKNQGASYVPVRS